MNSITLRKKITYEDFLQKLSTKEQHICATRGFGEGGWKNIIAFNPSHTHSQIDHFSEEKLKLFVQTEQKKDRIVLGFCSYDIGYTLHKIKQHAKNDLQLPLVYFASFENYVEFKEKDILLYGPSKEKVKTFQEKVGVILKRKSTKNKTVNTKKEKWHSNMGKTEYQKKYKKIKEYIEAGDIYQINLTHRLEGATEKNARSIFLEVLKKNHVNHLAYIEAENFEIISASPERFIKISKNKTIASFPIKGTRPRGTAKQEDEKLRQALIDSKKEAAELNMITDLIRNDIGKIAKIGSVKVEASRSIKKLEKVWHTESHIMGELKDDQSSIEALLSMSPGGSITGCPKKRAMEIIDELEPTTRSVYTGTIGYILPDDSGDFNIAIRTIIKKDKKAYLQVGGGIVYDSNLRNEYQETFDKAATFLEML